MFIIIKYKKMKKMKKMNAKVAVIALLLVCLLVDCVLVDFDVPHAAAIIVFSNALVGISMLIEKYRNNKRGSLSEKIFVRNGMLFVFAWWWSVISYIIFCVWGSSFITVVISVCTLVIIWQAARYIPVREILRYPFYLLCLFQGK
jgi:membrane protein YdbS with pleckstrin-like domain